MELKAELLKPYTNQQKTNFIVEQNHKLSYEIKETITALEAWGKTDEELLQEAKEAKYEEANKKAFEYLEGGNALFEFIQNENVYHIEATDGNIAKIGLKATALLIVQDYETTFPWNTKEDINIQINALEGKAIAEGLGAIQDIVWTIKFPHYLEEIEKAQTIEEVEAIVIDYTTPINEVEND